MNGIIRTFLTDLSVVNSGFIDEYGSVFQTDGLYRLSEVLENGTRTLQCGCGGSGRVLLCSGSLHGSRAEKLWRVREEVLLRTCGGSGLRSADPSLRSCEFCSSSGLMVVSLGLVVLIRTSVGSVGRCRVGWVRTRPDRGILVRTAEETRE